MSAVAAVLGWSLFAAMPVFLLAVGIGIALGCRKDAKP